MQLPKLTPLQSRLLASAIATGLLIIIWISFLPRSFVYAAELPTAPEAVRHSAFAQSIPSDLLEQQTIEQDDDIEEVEEIGSYEASFAYFDRSLVGRQQEVIQQLANNQMKEIDIPPGSTKNFVLEKSQTRAKRADAGSPDTLEPQVSENASDGNAESEQDDNEADENQGEDPIEGELRKRQRGNQVWISANVCRLPNPSPGNTPPTGDVPPLALYVSTSSSNSRPGPRSTDDLAEGTPVIFQGGYANFSLQTDSDVYIGISAPNVTKNDWEGNFLIQVAASVDGYYHNYNGTDEFLFMIDTDSNSALFITPNLTDSNSTTEVNKWMDMQARMPFTMYTFAADSWSPMKGLEHSFCGLQKQFKESNISVEARITTNYVERGKAKAQFHVHGLESGKTYNGFLAVSGSDEGLVIPNSTTVRAGGQVYNQFQWTTKADDSCQIVFGLDFCSDIAYAVPSNPTFKNNITGLAKLYDDQARAYYTNFNNSINQVACDTTGTAQYSLARTCNDCRVDYRTWLCSVLMPRCKDWSSTDAGLQERNVNAVFPNGTSPAAFNETHRNQFAYSKSRNPMIDDQIKPGPYKELLPCEDLCFDIVRSCPPQLGFSCPNSPAKESSYGKRVPGSRMLTCNFPGAVINLDTFLGDAARLRGQSGVLALVAGVVGLVLWI
ncbi:calcium channel subunit Mid1 [Massariosphaeria phaeospora]|uniref:Calcium channel subunit Mid1 n=1 Tax=Massariosphaeria phaeospora TaxID=100035 RepID=A0A7C8IJY1_9PLEO|nr:calcium channel subunit Mid1 [Massariosphaeria phaeospora]